MVEKNKIKTDEDKSVLQQTDISETAEKALPVPDKFKNADGSLNTAELLKSYLALERKLTEQSGKKLLPIGSMPATSKDYQIDLKQSGLVIDDEVNQRLFDLGFTQEQVQAVYDLAAEKVVPVIQQLANNYRADRDIAALEETFGGADRFNQVARQIFMWGQQNLEPDVFQALACSKEGVLTMYKMMNSSEPSVLKGKTDNTPLTEETLRQMMQDPRYWKQNDPAYTKKIEDGFKKLYG